MNLKSVYLTVFTLMLSGLDVLAGPQEQARRLHDRLTGAPPTPAVLNQMAQEIQSGRPRNAAILAMNSDHFYNIMLKNWFATWTNVPGDVQVSLNDYTATAIGIVRDDLSFDRALYDDIIYVGDDSIVSTLNADGSVAMQRILRPVDRTNNDHYMDLDRLLINLNNPTDLVAANRNRPIPLKNFLQRKQQSTVLGITDTAGVLTTRASGEAYFSAGTNRRAVRFAMKNFLCMDMPQLQDSSIPDFRVRRDVDRKPGGDSRLYKDSCVACHAGMDALGGAFARFNFQGGAIVQSAGVQGKMNQNNTMYPAGYSTADDSWLNLWANGVNASLGWKGEVAGRGAKEFGRMLSQTDAFSNCMTRRVFNRVCLREPATQENEALEKIAAEFSNNGRYNMRELFAAVATLPQCMGE
jgi:hypothetical protein